ncbi:hypothetical protein NOK12_39320 [Nocardioides sp. OK12]|nr:hypothetical protein NOK12_39320 [Nocardioides sp. OK12]
MRAAEAVMLYGVEVWAEALRKEKYRKGIAAVQRRGALRIACSYRTVSEPAVLVVAGVIPIDLLAPGEKIRPPAKVCPGKVGGNKACQVYQQQCMIKLMGAGT